MTPVRTIRDPAGTTVIGSSLALGPARRLMSTVVKATPEPGRGVLTSTGSAGTGSVATGLASAGAGSTGVAISTGGVSATYELAVPSCSRANQPVTSLYCTVTYPSVTWPVCSTVLPIGTVKIRSKSGLGPARIGASTVTLAGPTGSGSGVGLGVELGSGTGSAASSIGVSLAGATGTGVAAPIVSTFDSRAGASAGAGPLTGVGSPPRSTGKAAASAGDASAASLATSATGSPPVSVGRSFVTAGFAAGSTVAGVSTVAGSRLVVCSAASDPSGSTGGGLEFSPSATMSFSTERVSPRIQ